VNTLRAILFIFCASGLSVVRAQFVYTGDASALSCPCTQLTPDAASKNGSVHNATTVDLSTTFTLDFEVNFGNDDAGGEGMAFVMKSGAWSLGSGGYGLGYEGIAGNVLTVEFDTRDNHTPLEVVNFDVVSDHISLQDNGDINNLPANPNNLRGIAPTEIKPGFPDVEDGAT